MKKRIFGIITTTLLYGCTINQSNIDIKNGDFIFIEAETKKLSGAISRVTKDEKSIISFDHIAMIETDGKNYFVLEATTGKGSHRENLKTYLKRHKKENRILHIYRLKKEYLPCLDDAILTAKTMLGKPYNYTYTPNENEYYCSDFIERAFRNCSIFDLQPMTFINPETGKTDEYWLQHYQQLNAKIPEGELGCNPNGMSKSDKIYKIGTLK